MTVRGAVTRVATVLLIISVGALVVGQLFGQPVLLSYVTSASMEPTLSAGDGFIAIPAALAGPIERGDVVVYRAEEIQGGGLTTHRITTKTDRGYVTKGDNNAFTDQDNDEPPVTQSQIVAVAWQPGGTVVAIPGLGTLISGLKNGLAAVQRSLATMLGTRTVLGTQGLAYLVLALSVIAYAIDVYSGRNQRRRPRKPSRESGTSIRFLLTIVSGIIIIAATAAMVAPAGPQEFTIISAESDSPGQRIIEKGTSESVIYSVGNGGFVPVVTFFEPATEGVNVQQRELSIPARSSVKTTITVSAPPETGSYRRSVVVHRYLFVLPQPTIRGLYELHPWLPIIVIDVLLATTLYVLGVTLAGTDRIRNRSRDRRLPLSAGFRRVLRDLL